MGVTRHEQANRPSHLVRIVEYRRAAIGAHPPQQIPGFLVVIGEHGDAGIRPDVAQPLELAGRFGLGVDGAEDGITVKGECDGDDMWEARGADGGQPRDAGGGESLPRLVLRELQRTSPPVVRSVSPRVVGSVSPPAARPALSAT